MARFLVVLALAAVACATPADELPEADLSMRVATEPSPPVAGEEVRWILEVTNEGDDPVTLLFGTTQRGDVELQARAMEIYRWSDSRRFSTAREEVVLLPGSRVAFPLEDEELRITPGEYELLATLSGAPEPGVVRETITVEAPEEATATTARRLSPKRLG